MFRIARDISDGAWGPVEMFAVSANMRAGASAVAGGAAFVCAILAANQEMRHGGGDPWVHGALLLAITSISLSWMTAFFRRRTLEEALTVATHRLVAAARGDLSSATAPTVRAAAPDLAIAIDSLLSEVNSNIGDVETLALFDAVTGLANRTNFYRTVEAALASVTVGEGAALFFIDLDGFKGVNDKLGHAAGDKLLARVAIRLRAILKMQGGDRQQDIVVGRLAGDEFAVFVPACADRAIASATANALVEGIGDSFTIDGQQVVIGASIGISYFPEHGTLLSALLRAADVAMYHAKSTGRGRFEHYHESLAELLHSRAEVERELKRAIQQNEFVLLYQPQHHLRSGALIGAEALLRWQHPERGLLSPNHFVPLAEETGLIVQLGDQVLRTLCETVANWRTRGFDQRVAFNVSSREIAQPDFFIRLRGAMERFGVPGEAVGVEITETLAMEVSDHMLAELEALRAIGVQVAIDDFGAGYSNLARLKELPVDRVKLDRSIIRDITHSENARVICSALINLVGSLGFETVAEGVEDVAEIDLLQVMGCDAVQGFVHAPPLDERAFLGTYLSVAPGLPQAVGGRGKALAQGAVAPIMRALRS